MRITRALAAGAALALAALTAAPGGAAPAPSSVDAISASVGASTIAVSGTATFGGQDPVEVVYDGTGDSTVSQGVGLDVERLLISRASGATNNLTFTIDLDGLQGGGIPEGFQYNWDISVDGGVANGGDEWSIKAMRSGQGVQVGANPWAFLYRCVRDATTGNFTCTRQAPALAVSFSESAGAITITVPMNRIGAEGGSKIEAWARNGDPMWIRPSAGGAQTPGITVDGTAHDPYDVPGTTVQLGIAPAGTPVGAVAFSTLASVSGGSFSGALAKPGSGSYDVWAKACFGTNCGTSKTTLTI